MQVSEQSLHTHLAMWPESFQHQVALALAGFGRSLDEVEQWTLSMQSKSSSPAPLRSRVRLMVTFAGSQEEYETTFYWQVSP